MSATEDLLRAWVELVEDYAIFLADTAGNIVSWNDGAERITGYRDVEAIGRPVSIIFTPEDVASGEADREVGQALANGRAINERWHVRKDGSRFWGSGILTALRAEDGSPRGFVKAMRDLTERKAAEEELARRAEALREADRSKDEFLALLSHELRNPLVPILNSVHVLRTRLPSDDPVVRQSRDTIERQVLKLKRMVDDLLDVSRVATGKLRLRRKPERFGPIMDGAVESVRHLMLERRHELVISPGAAGDAVVEADAVRIEQVLTNLLTNAAKYTEPGGSVWLSAAVEADELVVRVRDSGIGMDEAFLRRVFDLFAQADTSIDRGQDGLGIGLALVRSLVEMHGGTIAARSEGPGHGSEFEVRLPLVARDASGAAPASPDASGAGPRRRRILLVDDNVDAARTLALVLRAAGHDLAVAHDGTAALHQAESHRPEVILLDIGLPGMSGFEVAAALRGRGSAAWLIAMSGYAEDDRAQAAGFDGYLLKPVGPDDILSMLAKLGGG